MLSDWPTLKLTLMATDADVEELELGEILEVYEFQVRIGVGTYIHTTLIVSIMNPFACKMSTEKSPRGDGG